jgi:hypothetical protein
MIIQATGLDRSRPDAIGRPTPREQARSVWIGPDRR